MVCRALVFSLTVLISVWILSGFQTQLSVLGIQLAHCHTGSHEQCEMGLCLIPGLL